MQLWATIIFCVQTFAQYQTSKNLSKKGELSAQSSQIGGIPLFEEVPLQINCSLPGWKIHNAVRLCNISHYDRENVLALDDGGIRYGRIN